jgi:hypothetical protein
MLINSNFIGGKSSPQGLQPSINGKSSPQGLQPSVSGKSSVNGKSRPSINGKSSVNGKSRESGSFKNKRFNYKYFQTRITKNDKSDSDDDDEEEDDIIVDDNDDELKIDFDKPVDDNYEGEQIEVDEIYDIEELDNMYKEESIKIDKNADEIKDLIENAIEKADDNRDDKLEKICVFQKTKNTSPYDDLLKNVFYKNYVYNQYIFDTDTIRVIKQKICTGVQADTKFNKTTPYIIPSRMYLWSEYEYEQKSK